VYNCPERYTPYESLRGEIKPGYESLRGEIKPGYMSGKRLLTRVYEREETINPGMGASGRYNPGYGSTREVYPGWYMCRRCT